MGFKLLDNEEYTNEYQRLSELPYVFMRSDLRKEIMTSPPDTSKNDEMMTQTGPPNTLYLRNRTLNKDHMIQFKSPENLGKFLELLPGSIYDESVTQAYYYVPKRHDSVRASSHDASKSQDESDSYTSG